MYRYIPIPVRQMSYTSVNNSYMYTVNASTHLNAPEISYNITIEQKPLEGSVVYIFLYALLVIMMGGLIYVLFLYSRYRYTGHVPTISMYRRPEGWDSLVLTYSYRGIAKILRELFIAIRDRIGCKYCTPREVASNKLSKSLFHLFAQLYEDVVYGAKDREDAYTVAEEVKRNIVEKE